MYVFHQIDLWGAFLIYVTSDPAKITDQVLVLFSLCNYIVVYSFLLQIQCHKILFYDAYWTKLKAEISNSAKVNYILQRKIWQHRIVSSDSNSAKPANSSKKFWNNDLTVLSQRPQLRYANLETSHRCTQDGGACRRHLIMRFLSAGNVSSSMEFMETI